MNIKKNQPLLVGKKIDMSIVFFFLYYIFMMRGLRSEIYLTFILLVLWVFFAFIMNVGTFLESTKSNIMLYVLFYIIFTFIAHYSFQGIVLGYVFIQLTFYIGNLMFVYYSRIYTYTGLKRILTGVLIIWFYYCIKALIIYYNNPYIARSIISNDADELNDVAIGGAYGLAYGSAILGVYFFSLLIKNMRQNKTIENVFISLFIIICFLLCLETGSTITFIAMIFGMLFNIYLSIIRSNFDKKSIVKNIFSHAFILGLVALLLLNLKKIALWLVNMTSSSENLLINKLETIAESILTGESSGTLASRESLYNKSLNTFFDNPIFGIYIEKPEVINPMIGEHSALFDHLGEFGIFGFALLFLIFFTFIKEERKQNKVITNGAFILTFIILFTMNPFDSPLAYFGMFFIIPSISLLKKKQVIYN